jgi:hypothetical protein
MPNRVARIASVIFASVLAGATITTISYLAADAAEGCRTEPGDQTPDGKHWYYRIEHPGNRQCWYLRGEGEKPAQAGVTQRSEKAAEPPAETSTPQRSLADAHAELPWPQPRVQQDTAASMPQRPQAMPSQALPTQALPTQALPTQALPTDAAQGAQRPNVLESTRRGSLIGSRWPDPGADSTANLQAATPDRVAEAQPDQTTTPAQAAPPAALTTADTSPARVPASLPTLMMVVAGALALAGLTGSAIFRLGSRRRRPAPKTVGARRRVAWEAAEGGRQSPPRQPSPRQPPPQAPPEMPSKMPPWIDPEFARRPNLAPGFHEASEHDDHNERLDKISEFLERMSRQPSH